MATAEEVKDDLSELLKCPICLEIFRIPKYLPCLHTFCESCISTYMLTSYTLTTNACGYTCPVCPTFNLLEENPGVPETWATRLPINHLMTSMIELLDITRSEKLCNACQLSSISKNAMFWCTVCGEAYCTECANYHRKFRMSLNHKIISMEELKSSDTVFGKSEFVRCAFHSDKPIDFFCHGHSESFCTICATNYHRKCERVTTIAEATNGYKTATKTTELYQKLQQYSKEINICMTINENNKTEIETESTNINSEIDRVKKTITKHLSIIEKKTKVELSMEKGRILQHIEHKAMELTSLKCTVDSWKRTMDAAIKHGSELQCLIEVNRLLSRINRLENDFKCAIPFRTESLKFKPINSITNFKRNVFSLGMFSIEMSSKKIPPVNMQTGQIEIVQVLDAANGQSQNSYGSGIFLANSILLTNEPSSRVVKFNSEFVYQSELKLPYGPYDITKIDDTKFAIGVKPQIIIINVRKLKIRRTLTINVSFWGLQYVCPTYIVAHSETLTWINASSGSSKRDFKTDGHSNYVHASKENEYICAFNANTVSKYVDGETKFTYTTDQLSHPRGIDVDYDGNIYICGYASKNIHQLTKDGKLVRTIPVSTLGISSPWIIRFEINRNRFLLTDFDSGKVVVCKIC